MSLLSERLDECKNAIEAFLAEVLSTTTPALTELYASMRYSAMAGGKRLRPFLALESCRLCGGEPSSAMFYAAALEMVHTYSLIHDDLPSMDNDDMRRGKPTNHKVFGEALAILAGDGLLTAAFELIASAPLSAEQNARAVRILARAAGPDGMVGGQVLDIGTDGEEKAFSDHVTLCTMKTGALFRASVLLGAVAANVEETDALWQSLSDYAEDLGLAFQVTDDLLDVYGDAEQMGKNTGSDASGGKTTFLSFCTAEEARSLTELLLERAEKAIRDYPGSNILCELVRSLSERTN